MAKIRFCTLFSGSSANSTYIEADGRGILIDAGAGVRRLSAELNGIGSDFGRVQAIFITHEHSDHISGLSTVLRNYRIPVLAPPATLRSVAFSCRDVDQSLFCPMSVGAKAVNGPFAVSSFASSHDCVQGVGYIVDAGGVRIGVLTDTGEVNSEMLRRISSCRALVLESNHDVAMLKKGRYPAQLKARILGSRGHLSNEQCAEALCRIDGCLDNVLLAHLSRENNLPELALSTVRGILSAHGIGQDRLCVRLAPAAGHSAVIEYEV